MDRMKARMPARMNRAGPRRLTRRTQKGELTAQASAEKENTQAMR